jgi:hypothetical protein
MDNITETLPARPTVVAAGHIPPRRGGRPMRLVVLDTTGPVPVRVELVRAPQTGADACP